MVVAGGSGSLGRRLTADLTRRGHDVVVLTRRPDRDSQHRQVSWDGRTVGAWAAELDGAAVVNLSGALVDRRPTPANIELLTTSRVEPTRALAAAAAELARPVPVWVQASTAAIYGDAGDAVLTESSPPADGPPQMAGVARAWEAAVDGVHAASVVVLRTSIVLDRDSPALDRLLLLTRWGLGGRVGSGRQWVSWIHIEDWLAIVRATLTDPSLSGVLIASSPSPVRNSQLMADLRAVVGRPPVPPTPTPVVRLGALLLRTDPALGLTGRRVLPARLQAAGFDFAHVELHSALRDLISTRR
ncbi:TIGR01777 family oxidoreductase [Aquipuribacter nitratireducens]|uniref:TIGR01777 family oxidoreductase n=1 Tax=Aquipuribacter nitratireducens TaxID=650104 RepID=A0ABW0GLD5_9MICO